MDIPKQSFRCYLDGDKSAFAEVLDAFRERLIYFINGFVHNTDTAEDIAADVFAFLILHPEKYDFSYPLKAYLYTVARSRAIDCLRRRKRIPVLPIDNCGEITIEYRTYNGFISDGTDCFVLSDTDRIHIEKKLNSLGLIDE